MGQQTDNENETRRRRMFCCTGQEERDSISVRRRTTRQDKQTRLPTSQNR